MNDTVRKIIIAIAAVAVLAVVAVLVFGGPGAHKSASETATDIISAFENTGKFPGIAATDLAVSVDIDAIAEVAGTPGGPIPENILNTIRSVASVISNLKIHALTGMEDSSDEIALSLKDTDLARFRIGLGESEISVVSDLVPGWLLKVDPAKAGFPSFGKLSLTEEEEKAFDDAALAKYIAFNDTVRARLGEAEKGSWTFEGTVFTMKQHLDMTAKELASLTLQSVKELLEDPASQKVTEAFGDQFSPAKVGEALADLETADEKNFPAMTYYVYSNGAGDEYHDVLLEKDGQTVAAGVSVIGSTLKARSDVTTGTDHGVIEAVIDAEALTASVAADIHSNGIAAKLVFDLQSDKTGAYTGSMNMIMNDRAVMTVSLAGKPTDEPFVLSFSEEGMKTVTAEDLSGKTDTGKEFTAQLFQALPGLLQKAAEAMPDEITQLQSLFGGAAQ